MDKIFSLVRLVDLSSTNHLMHIDVSKSKSILLDQIEKDLNNDKPFWFGTISGHSFIYMELKNIDTNVFLYNHEKIAKTPLIQLNQLFHSDALTASGVSYSSKTIWELFTSEHHDMRELCDMTLVNAAAHTKLYIKNEIRNGNY